MSLQNYFNVPNVTFDPQLAQAPAFDGFGRVYGYSLMALLDSLYRISCIFAIFLPSFSWYLTVNVASGFRYAAASKAALYVKWRCTADALQAGASQFEASAGKLKRKFWWKNMKVSQIFGG